MNPVSGGFVPHRTRGDGDYEAQKRAALAQSKKNDFIQGLQTVHEAGFGQSISDTRSDVYGNVNIMPQQLLEGAGSNFSQPGDTGNAPLADAANQTGLLEGKTSATKQPSLDPAQFETSALDAKLQSLARGGMQGLNDRASLYKLGG